ncbi:bacteriohemerythrin [Fusibacter tunisiensis]|uniref:Hemerythrin n=1 Tax=Fusibacter tunisiensis TaxID=1008308 RepID=A0ABS2MUH5_9FIRM|nr:bacteriohemerythrin [Fusibacter tunisiensis]MBM7563062.1 hemerythrin [Fusibacter tunisiensis]
MFIWKKEFELGIKSIDEQHKCLLDLGNRINELLVNHDDDDDNYDEIYEVIEELRAYTVYHFNTEEELFLKYNYPEYHAHKKEHDDFVAFLKSVNPEDIDENQKGFLKKLLAQIVQWVFKHIITTDYMYKDYLLRIGMK